MGGIDVSIITNTVTIYTVFTLKQRWKMNFFIARAPTLFHVTYLVYFCSVVRVEFTQADACGINFFLFPFHIFHFRLEYNQICRLSMSMIV